MSSHLKNIEQSGGLFKPEHGEAERRASEQVPMACEGEVRYV